MSAASSSSPASTNWRTRSSPSPSMSIAPRLGPVHEPLHALRRAVDVDAVVVRLALDAHERLAALRALLRELPAAACRGGRLASTGPDDLGDHVAGAAHDHGVAGPHVLARDVVLVVQRRHADVGAADEHRLEHRERRRAAGAADAHHDVAQDRGLLLGRELVGDRPARRARREAHLRALAEVVDLHDHAVDLVAERVPVRLHLARRTRTPRRDRRAPRSAGSPGSRARAATRASPRACAAAGRPPPRRAGTQNSVEVARRGDARVLLAQAARPPRCARS